MPSTRAPGDFPPRRARLYVNIDHVATIRQARRADEPDPVAAALLCETAGADGITAHLREDRRHIQDADIMALHAKVGTVLNLEMANTPEMVALALQLRPFQVTLVPEKREEVTTEGGLDVHTTPSAIRDSLEQFREAGIRSALFVDPTEAAVRQSLALGADAVELHTGTYAHHPLDRAPIASLAAAARLGASLGIAVHAGHGLTVANVGPVAAIPEIEELNIGHSLISRSVFVGLWEAVTEMRAAMDAARSLRP